MSQKEPIVIHNLEQALKIGIERQLPRSVILGTFRSESASAFMVAVEGHKYTVTIELIKPKNPEKAAG